MMKHVPDSKFKPFANTKIALSRGFICLEAGINEGDHFEVITDRPDADVTFIIPDGSRWEPPKAYFDFNNRSVNAIEMGPLVLRPGGMPIKAFGTGKGRVQIVMCAFNSEYFAETTGLREWDEKMLAQCLNLRSTTIATLMRRIWFELRSDQFGGNLALESLTNLMLVELGRFFLSTKPALSSSRRLAPWQIRKIEECLRESVNYWPSLSELAELCGVSVKHLSRAFSDSTGMSLRKYSEKIRIERAQHLLAESHLAVKQVAATLGFSNANYFSSAFHRATGESPREFINRT